MVVAMAGELAGQAWRRVSWREGRAGLLSSRFARVRAAHQGRPREEEWLIIEWPEGADESAHYGFSTLPQNTSWSQMAGTVMSRWRIERDDQELKQELGLGHYEGRNWRGFHHHASLCMAAYLPAAGRRLFGFGATLRQKKNAARFKAPALPQGFQPRGARPPACSRQVQRHEPTSIATCRFRLARAIAQVLRQCPCCGHAREDP